MLQSIRFPHIWKKIYQYIKHETLKKYSPALLERSNPAVSEPKKIDSQKCLYNSKLIQV